MPQTQNYGQARHAGDFGLFTAAYAAHVLHMIPGMLWLGGLSVLVTGRLGLTWIAERAALQRFSRIALVLFSGAVVTGFSRLLVQKLTAGTPGNPYLTILALKCVAICGVTYAAACMRRVLLRPHNALTDYDRSLTTEIFFAALLVFLTALLTQIPPT